ncbi:MAG: hypothetical protein OEY50_03000 [Nitrospinota bacterium]|nr:hypothetical protein [Nitrospinota bacterium]MDH5679017.1 hypothetical protein [Nitrospinota bacterium]
MIRITYALLFGAYFGMIQTAYFFGLEILLTAAYTSFVTATLAWIGGAIAGLFLPDGHGTAQSSTSPAGPLVVGPLIGWHVAGLAAYYITSALLFSFPYNFAILPFCLPLIMVSGAQTGHFFRVNQPFFPTTAQLFLWENNGFIIGWLAGFTGFVVFGIQFLRFGPAALGLALAPLIFLRARSARVEQKEPTGEERAPHHS